ncbi:hypothetical protein WMY93_028936 [Mugilogobius chulae]|uniref:Uncharacterized protein n=1 Tax=Mugilogobius chulae TaxID=88201 RepID=A0AAW0MUG4_9GOBI
MCAPLRAVSELASYLQDSELVARFQRRCGLHLVRGEEGEEAQKTEEQVRKSSVGTAEEDAAAAGARGSLRQRSDNNNSSVDYKENGHCVKEQSGPEYEVRRPLLHKLFLFSAALGNEVFYISCLPWLHWNLDPFLCRRLVNMWTVRTNQNHSV